MSKNKLPTDPYDKRELIWWMMEHPMFRRYWNKKHHMNAFYDLTSITLAYVNPKTHMVEDNLFLNTHPEIWIESGPFFDMSTEKTVPEPEDGWNYNNKFIPSHDIRLDCGADTLEEAFLQLALLVKEHYGDY